MTSSAHDDDDDDDDDTSPDTHAHPPLPGAFDATLRLRLEYYSRNGDADKLTKTLDQVDDLKSVMVDNIGKALARGVRMNE